MREKKGKKVSNMRKENTPVVVGSAINPFTIGTLAGAGFLLAEDVAAAGIGSSFRFPPVEYDSDGWKNWAASEDWKNPVSSEDALSSGRFSFPPRKEEEIDERFFGFALRSRTNPFSP